MLPQLRYQSVHHQQESLQIGIRPGFVSRLQTLRRRVPVGRDSQNPSQNSRQCRGVTPSSDSGG